MENVVVGDFSTWFYIGKVAEHEKIVEAFTPFIENREKYFEQPWIYSRNCWSSIYSDGNFDLPWDVFLNGVKPNIEDYFLELQPLCEYNIEIYEMWANIYDKDGFQEIHDHAFPERNFCLNYFLEYPEDANAPTLFENVHHTINQAYGVNRIFDRFNCEKFIPQPEPGSIVIWPSWIKHYTLPNQSNNRRTTFSANINVTGKHK